MLRILCNNDLERRLTEFRHHLPAYAAGNGIVRRNISSSPDYADCLEFPHIFTDRFKDCGALGAHGGSIGGIFDVASGKYPPVSGKQCRADFVFGIRCVGIAALGGSRLYEFSDQFFIHHPISMQKDQS